MPEFWNALDHREQALLLVTAAAIVLALAIRAVRPKVPGLLTIVVSPPLGPLLFGAVVYVAAIIAVLAEIGVWTMPLLGVTVGWAVASAGAMFFTVGDPVSDQDYFERALRRSVRWTLIFEFLVALYVFDLAIEVVLLLVLVSLGMLKAVADPKNEHASLRGPLDVIIGALGLALLAYGVWGIATGFDSFATFENLMRLVLPPALTVAFIPYAYALRMYVRWEQRRLDRRRRHRWA